MQVATPEPSSGCASQPLTPPPEKSTVPVGLDPVTVAVKVTLWPKDEGFGEVVRLVPDVTGFTVWLTMSELGSLLLSPP